MKYKFPIILLTLFVLTCKSTQVNNNEVITQLSHSDKQVSQIEGLVIIGSENRVCISYNWKSKSKITYIVTGDYLTDITDNMGKIVVVTGNITELDSPWLKELEVTSILEIRDNP